MRTFEVAVALPHYTPTQALSMQQDERFQQWVAEQGNTQRTVLADLHTSSDGMAAETSARVTCGAQPTSKAIRLLLREAEPQLIYDETTRFTLPPHVNTAVEVLSPTLAAGCVTVNVDISFDPMDGGTCRTLRASVDVAPRWWLPERTRIWAEDLLVTQLTETLQNTSQRAVAWAEANPEIYPEG